jgi:hypothetical protein
MERIPAPEATPAGDYVSASRKGVIAAVSAPILTSVEGKTAWSRNFGRESTPPLRLHSRTLGPTGNRGPAVVIQWMSR